MSREPMSEAEATAVLAAAARFGINPSLHTITRLCEALGEPQRAYRVVQVGGTNGKGSTVRMTDALLRAHGQRSGAFVSPQMHSLTEHVLIDGAPVPGDLFAAGVSAAVSAAAALGDSLPEPPTQFELLTAAALWILREAGVGWGVLEVGMGGRWDSTSVSAPEVSVVTSVGLDHVDYLGPTLERIAWDKAHIIRHGGLAVLGPGTEETDEVFAERARNIGARLVRVREDVADADVSFTVTRHMQTPDGVTEIETSVLGETYGPLSVSGPAYQAANAVCALSAVRLALSGPLDVHATRSALGGLRIAGRFEVLARQPWVIADVAHNAGGARVLAEAVARAFGRRPVTVVIGMLTDKDAAAVVSVLAPVAARFVVTAPDSPRALDARVLVEMVEDVTGTGPVVCPDVAGAVAAARESGSPVLVTGSVVTVAEARVACGVYPG